MQKDIKPYYSDLITKIHEAITIYQQNTANTDRDSIVLCLTQHQYYTLEILFKDLYQIDLSCEECKFNGIDIITSDLFYPNAPFIAEKGKPR